MLSVHQLSPQLSAVVSLLEVLSHTLWSCPSAMLAMLENLHPTLGKRLSAVMAVLWISSHTHWNSLSAVMGVPEHPSHTVMADFSHTLWSCLSAMSAMSENIHPKVGNRLTAVMAVLGLPSNTLLDGM